MRKRRMEAEAKFRQGLLAKKKRLQEAALGSLR
jgi:hypothetical protein